MPRAETESQGKTKTLPYDVADQLQTPEEMAADVDALLTVAPDDPVAIARALRDIACAMGMSQVAGRRSRGVCDSAGKASTRH
jgi:DNA-binding phage protein